MCLLAQKPDPEVLAHEETQLAKLKAKMLAPDALLTGSNFMSVPECLLLRWLAYHHNKVTLGPARRLVDFDRDLRDGSVLAGVILSHCPFLGDSGKPLCSIHWTPKSEDEYLANANAVVAALKYLQLDFPLSADVIVNTGAGVSDGVGLEPKQAVSPSKMSIGAGSTATALTRTALYDSGGVLAHSAGSVVEMGDGYQRENLLAVLYLFQHLPQQVPRTEIEFKGALGATITKAIELKNPTKRAITYHVSLEGPEE